MNTISKLPAILILCSIFIFAACSSDDGGDPQLTPEQIQTAKLIGTPWTPGTVIQEIDGEITDDRFGDFSITFNADSEGNNKKYTIVNTGGEAFETGTKNWEYVSGNINLIERTDNGFQFSISLTNNNTELRIDLTVAESGSPLGRTSNTTGGYVFNLLKN